MHGHGQEHALSQVFDEVKTKLHDARVDANSATHQLQVSVNRLLRQATMRTNALAQKISPAQLQTRVTTARARYDAAASSCFAAMSERLQSGKERLGLAAASLDALRRWLCFLEDMQLPRMPTEAFAGRRECYSRGSSRCALSETKVEEIQ
jgi:exonuclease VII large subunit